MFYAMSRVDYEALFTEDEARVYPKDTRGAIRELRDRGLDADTSRLDYLMRLDKIQKPFGSGRNLKWLAENIDEAAGVLERMKSYTPQAATWAQLHVLYAQQQQALREAQRLWPEVHEQHDLLAFTVFPYAHGYKGLPATQAKGYADYPYNMVFYTVDEPGLKTLNRRKDDVGRWAGDLLAKRRAREKAEKAGKRAGPAKRRDSKRGKAAKGRKVRKKTTKTGKRRHGVRPPARRKGKR